MKRNDIICDNCGKDLTNLKTEEHQFRLTLKQERLEHLPFTLVECKNADFKVKPYTLPNELHFCDGVCLFQWATPHAK